MIEARRRLPRRVDVGDWQDEFAVSERRHDTGNQSAGRRRVHEVPCPDCGEMVRKGLLRCWNCGAFMDKGIEARFQEMQENPAPMIFSEVPEDDEPVSVETTQMVTSASDDDFQLAGSIGTVLPADQQTDAADAAEDDDGGDDEPVGEASGSR